MSNLPRAWIAKASWWKRFWADDGHIVVFCSLCRLPKHAVNYRNRCMTQTICTGEDGKCYRQTIVWS